MRKKYWFRYNLAPDEIKDLQSYEGGKQVLTWIKECKSQLVKYYVKKILLAIGIAILTSAISFWGTHDWSIFWFVGFLVIVCSSALLLSDLFGPDENQVIKNNLNKFLLMHERETNFKIGALFTRMLALEK